MHICQLLAKSDVLSSKLLSKHVGPVIIVVEQFLINLQIKQKYQFLRDHKARNTTIFSEKFVSFKTKPLCKLLQTKNYKNPSRIHIEFTARPGVHKKSFLEYNSP